MPDPRTPLRFSKHLRRLYWQQVLWTFLWNRLGRWPRLQDRFTAKVMQAQQDYTKVFLEEFLIMKGEPRGRS